MITNRYMVIAAQRQKKEWLTAVPTKIGARESSRKHMYVSSVPVVNRKIRYGCSPPVMIELKCSPQEIGNRQVSVKTEGF
jgi:hypothetical protein